MRLSWFFAIFVLLLVEDGQAQGSLGIGDIAAPVLNKPAKPDATPAPDITPPDPNKNTQPAKTDEPSSKPGSGLDLPRVDLMQGRSAMELGSKFDNIQQAIHYRSLEIVEPASNSTVDIRTSNLFIKANVVPPVRSDLGHVLQITVDSKVLAENQTSFVVDDLEPGTRTLALRIVDENGNVISQSKSIVVLVK